MADDVLLNKAATIERCVARSREEYAAAGAAFLTHFTRQDAAILNVQRACEATLDMGHHLIRRERLGLPQSVRDVFDLLAAALWIDAPLADALKNLIGFRQIATRDEPGLMVPIAISVITCHLDEFLQFSATVLKLDAQTL